MPRSRAGARYPKFKGKRCYGADLSQHTVNVLRAEKQLNLSYILDAYKNYPNKNKFIDKLYGSDNLRNLIHAGVGEPAIRKTWQKDLIKFKKVRQKYLLYP